MSYLTGKIPGVDNLKALSARIIEAGDEDKLVLEIAIADGFHEKSFGANGFKLCGVQRSIVVTVAGASGTLSLTIAGTAYAEAFDTDIETTIDNWIASHAAAILSAKKIVAAKTAVDGITLTGGPWAGAFTYTDSSTTMTATSGGNTDTFEVVEGPFFAIQGVSGCTLNASGTITSAGDPVWPNMAVANDSKLLGPFTQVQLSAGTAIAYLV